MDVNYLMSGGRDKPVSQAIRRTPVGTLDKNISTDRESPKTDAARHCYGGKRRK